MKDFRKITLFIVAAVVVFPIWPGFSRSDGQTSPVEKSVESGKAGVAAPEMGDPRGGLEAEPQVPVTAAGEEIIEPAVPEEEKASAPEVEAGEEEPAPPAPREEAPTAPGRVTFDFKDADLRNILRIFSVRYGINIVAGPDVQGKVTIRLVDVPWERALKLILESNDYSYVREDNVYRVLSREKLAKEPLETKVFPLSYAKAAEVLNSITHLLSPDRGQIKADERSNTLVVTDVPAQLARIEEIIERLDQRTPQVLIEARIVELSDDFDENIGIDWVSLKSFNVSFGPPEDAEFEGLYRFTREHARDKTDETTKAWQDRERTTTTRGRSRTDQAGPDGTTTTTTISTVPGTSSGTTITTTSGTSLTDTRTLSDTREFYDWYDAVSQDVKSDVTGTEDLLQAVLTPDAFQVTLSFLQEQTDANVISHPKLVTADNKQALIKVSKEWPIPKFQFNDDTGQWEISDFEWKDIGIILTVTPHVNKDNFVTMKVIPEISQIFDTITFGGALQAELPITQTRRAETEVLVKNGDTLAIGGLIAESEGEIINKVPLLGELPILGRYLFTHTLNSVDRTNIIIFLTANVVTPENKDEFWISQREQQDKMLNIPKTKWWEPKKLRFGLGSQAGY